MKNVFFTFLLIFTSAVFSQKDSLNVGGSYLEDQLYVSLSFNQLYDQPSQVTGSGFSYGFNMGYLKDIPLNKKGTIALAAGLGYAYDSFKHGFKLSLIDDTVLFEALSNIGVNSLRIHWLEVPFEFRWRTSSPNKYKFWRIYTGFKVGYSFQNSLSYAGKSYSNVDRFEKFQYGLTLSLGYAAFNLNVYYGLQPLFKDLAASELQIQTKILRMGLVFYLL